MDKDEARAVTQADRLLFADLFDLPQRSAQAVFAGEQDSNPNVMVKLIALARHRITFAAEARADQKERDAQVAEGLRSEFADAENAGNDEAEEAWHSGMAHAANRVAMAIRSQDHD